MEEVQSLARRCFKQYADIGHDGNDGGDGGGHSTPPVTPGGGLSARSMTCTPSINEWARSGVSPLHGGDARTGGYLGSVAQLSSIKAVASPSPEE